MIDQMIIKYSVAMSKPVSKELQNLQQETYESMKGSQMLSGAVHANLFNMLCKTLQAKFALEVGTYTGYSALAVAEALPNDGKLIALDIEDGEPQKLARKYWSQSQHGSKIELMVGNKNAQVFPEPV